jgi:uncharacterized protein (TIGR02284 family)
MDYNNNNNNNDNDNDEIDFLNDLVQINNDRIEGYEKAIEDTRDAGSDYQSIFSQMIDQSQRYKQELVSVINSKGGDADRDSTTNSGKIYRTWMDVKSAFAGKSDKSALELCEFGEDAAQKAYKEALESGDLSEDARSLVTSQKTQLKQSHDLIKAQRDMEKARS